jgi:hypothetical protein
MGAIKGWIIAIELYNNKLNNLIYFASFYEAKRSKKIIIGQFKNMAKN